jgi:archaeal cell division control protein 6
MASFDQILSAGSIFRDVSVLSPHYVPKVLPFRENQIHEIMSVLSPALKGQKPRNLIIYGPSGTGKTCTVKRVMEEFVETAKTRETKATMHYINCRIYGSRYRILQRVLREYLPELEKSGFGLPYLYEKLLETVSKGEQLTIILDEVDVVKDLDDLVYTLTRSNDEIKRGGVSLVGISNKLSFKDSLETRTRSSLYESEIIFHSYQSEQLQKILEQRAREGFEPGVVEQSAINLAAAITSQESGDARYALTLLHKAGENAQIRGSRKICDDDVESARKKVEMDLTIEAIKGLPEMNQFVLYAIATLSQSGSRYTRLEGMDNGMLFSGEVYEEYERACKKARKRPRSARWYREYLNDLELLGLIITTQSGKGIRGQTTLIKICPNAAHVIVVLGRTLF